MLQQYECYGHAPVNCAFVSFATCATNSLASEYGKDKCEREVVDKLTWWCDPGNKGDICHQDCHNADSRDAHLVGLL